MPAREIPWRRWIPWIVVSLVVLVAAALILPMIEQAREAAQRSTDLNNLRQIGLALHNYHDAHKCLPPGSIISEEGVAEHGWMTFILPFLDAAPTYNFIDFDYPWDDPFNAHVFRFSHPFLRMPVGEPLFTTEGYGVANYAGSARVFYRNSSVTLRDLGEGTSHVWLVSDIFESWPPWAAPFNWRELNWPVSGIDGPNGWAGGVGLDILMADGSARFVVRDEIEVLSRADQQSESEAASLQRTKPDVRYEYSNKRFGGDGLRLDDDEEGLMARVWNDRSGAPDCLLICPSGQIAERTPTLDDLRQVVEKFSDARIVLIDLDLSDEGVDVLSSMPRLEVLRMGRIEVTDAGMEGLQNMKSLKILGGSASEEMQARLREALPDCELRLKLP